MSELKFEVAQTAGIITVDFEKVKAQAHARMEEYRVLVYTEDGKKDLKKDLAELRQYRKDITETNSEVRKAYMKPYDAFNKNVKEVLGIIDEQIAYLDGQLKELEEKRVREKKADIEKVYKEIVPENLEDYIPLECIYGAKWNNSTTSMKSICSEITAAVQKTVADISVISSMNSEKVQDALNLYMSNRNLASAIKYISDYEARKSEILEKQKKQEADRAEALRQEEIERIRREERARIARESQIRNAAKKEAVEELKSVDEEAAAPLKAADSKKVIYTIVATEYELKEIEMALTSLGVYFERKDV